MVTERGAKAENPTIFWQNPLSEPLLEAADSFRYQLKEVGYLAYNEGGTAGIRSLLVGRIFFFGKKSVIYGER